MLKSSTMNLPMETEVIEKFDHLVDMVDVFLGFYCNKLHFSFAWKVCKVVFVLSQWQAGLEFGFSVNLEVLDENMHDLSLLLLWMVYDHVTASDVNIHDLKAPKALTKEVKFVHQQYVQRLEKQKQFKSQMKQMKRRKLFMNK